MILFKCWMTDSSVSLLLTQRVCHASQCFSCKFRMHTHNHQFLKSRFWCIYLGNYVYTYKENARQSKAISRLLSLVQMFKPWGHTRPWTVGPVQPVTLQQLTDFCSSRLESSRRKLASVHLLATVNLTHWESIVVFVFSSSKTRGPHLPCFSDHLKAETWYWSHVKANKLQRHCVPLRDLGLWRTALFYWVIIETYSQSWLWRLGWEDLRPEDQFEQRSAGLMSTWMATGESGSSWGRTWAGTGLHWHLAYAEESPQAARSLLLLLHYCFSVLCTTPTLT